MSDLKKSVLGAEADKRFRETKFLFSAAVKKYEAEKSEAIAILDVYLNKPVAIGEHPDLLTEIDKYVEKLASAEDKLGALLGNFNPDGSYVDPKDPYYDE